LRGRTPRTGDRSRSWIDGGVVAFAVVFALLGVGGWASWTRRVDWRVLVAVAQSLAHAEAPTAKNAAPVARDAALPLPRRGEEMLTRARGLAAGGHLREALSTLDRIRITDPQRADADRLRGDIQRQLLALTVLPAPSDREKGERRDP